MKSVRKSKECTRHVKSQETLLPVCIGCMLHANLLKKEIVDRLHALDMLIAKSNSAVCHISDLAGVEDEVVSP